MTPIKRGLGILIILFLLPAVFAAHSATISSDYIPIYETNSANISLAIENALTSTSTINNVNIIANGFNINNIITLVDWSMINNGSINFLTELAGISNWGSQRFGFDLAAGNVKQDETFSWTITTTDRNGEQSVNTLNFHVLNDNTPPVITQTLPGQYILGQNELFSIEANDPETGINSANAYISTCDDILDPNTNSSSRVYETNILNCAGNTCSINKDLTALPEGNVCFYFDVSNKGGETAVTENLITIIDRTAPTVALLAPNNNIFVSGNSINLDFYLKDNYDSELDCNVVVNGNSNSLITTEENNSYALSVNEGSYSWNVNCEDEVGLIGTSETRTFNVDNSAPTINITVPEVNDRNSNVVINVAIEDLGSGVNQSSTIAEITDTEGNVIPVTVVNDQIIYPTTISTIPGNYTVTITAADNLGQSSTQSQTFRIRETYTITLNLVSRIDASTPNNTIITPLTGTIAKDNGDVVLGTVDIVEMITNETLDVDNGTFQTQLTIPETNGIYTIIATFTNGIDTFIQTASISVGPYCGNNQIDLNEQCDGTAIPQTCSDYGFSQGTLSCSASCTIISTECSNPPKQRSSGRSNSGVIIPIQQPLIEIPIIEELTTTSNEIVEIEPNLKPIVQKKAANEVLVTPKSTKKNINEFGLGIGAAWGAFTDFTSKINLGIIGAMTILLVLLYLFGWKGKKDEWDNYFEKYGHH